MEDQRPALFKREQRLVPRPGLEKAAQTFRFNLWAVMSDACATVAIAVSKAMTAEHATNAVRGYAKTAATPSAEC